MSDYISREKLSEKLAEAYNKGYITWGGNEIFKEIIADIPSADVREVVHCKDCRFYRQGTMNFHGRCNWHGGLEPDEDWFCADGERIENERHSKTHN